MITYKGPCNPNVGIQEHFGDQSQALLKCYKPDNFKKTLLSCLFNLLADLVILPIDELVLIVLIELLLLELLELQI